MKKTLFTLALMLGGLLGTQAQTQAQILTLDDNKDLTPIINAAAEKGGTYNIRFSSREVVIDNWEAVKSEVIRFQQAFPYCKVAGWDIAITDEGPVVIEINDFWDRTGQFFIRKGWRNEIRDCYLAWKTTGKDYMVYPQRLPLDDKNLTAKFQ